MDAVRRWLLISFLIMTLPLRGLAAIGYMGCNPLLAPPPAMTHAHAVDQGVVHGHGDHVGLQDEVSDQLVKPAVKADALPKQMAEKPPIKAALKCTQCAPCCGAAAPPVGIQPLPSFAGPTELKVSVHPLELGGDSGRLDRPPRSILV